MVTTDSTAAAKPNPLAEAAVRKLAQADDYAARFGKRATWVPDEHCWLIPSSREGEPAKRVSRKAPAAETVDATTGEIIRGRPNKGYWWFVLSCDCEAAEAGFAVCWHKAAVFRWWQEHRRIDGDAYADRRAFSPAAAHANSHTDPDGVERWKDKTDAELDAETDATEAYGNRDRELPW